MKGYRTVLYGLAVAVVPAGLNYLVGVDWTKFGLNPLLALAIGAGIVILRRATDTALGVKVPPDPSSLPEKGVPPFV